MGKVVAENIRLMLSSIPLNRSPRPSLSECSTLR